MKEAVQAAGLWAAAGEPNCPITDCTVTVMNP